MKSVAAILAFGLITVASAQEQCASVAAEIPSCATQCIAEAAQGAGCSDVTDFACQCENTAAINAAALECVLSGCGAETGLEARASASAVCECVSSAGSSPSSTEASSTPAETSAVPTGPGPVVVESSMAPSSPAQASAPYPTTTAAVSQISDGQVQAGTGAAAPTGSNPGNGTVPFTGAGIKLAGSVVGIVVGLGAAVVAM